MRLFCERTGLLQSVQFKMLAGKTTGKTLSRNSDRILKLTGSDHVVPQDATGKRRVTPDETM